MVKFSAPVEFPAAAAPSPSKRLRRSPKETEAEQQNGQTFNASFDMDILECHICLETLSVPTFQCSNGHLQCSNCCLITKNKCGTCSEETGKVRCLAIEKLIETLQVSCMHADSGCVKTLKYAEKKVHELSCSFAPYACPFPNCYFRAPLKDFSSHFLELHKVRIWELLFGSWNTIPLKSNDRHILLKATDKLFLLYNDIDQLGNLAYLRQFCPLQQETSFMYHMVVRKGRRRLSLESHPQSILTEERQPRDFLLIPMQTYAKEGAFEIEICIRSLEIDGNISASA